MIMTLKSVPRIDIAPLFDETASVDSRRAVSERIGQAAEQIGFLTVTGHPISSEELAVVFDAYARFFSQRVEDKLLVQSNAINRGYVPAKGEQVDPTANPDFKECFDSMLELPLEDAYVQEGVPLYGPNQWPEVMPEMKAVVNAYYDKANTVGLKVLEALAESLGDPHFFDEKFNRPMAMLRANYYPARPDDLGDKDFGIAPHSDYGCLTLLAQNGVSGLEVQNSRGEWVGVEPNSNDLVINVGEMLEAWSAGKFKATLHRVIGSSEERMSLPLFLNPDYKTRIVPIGRSQGDASALTAGEYLNARYAETYVHRQSKVV